MYMCAHAFTKHELEKIENDMLSCLRYAPVIPVASLPVTDVAGVASGRVKKKCHHLRKLDDCKVCSEAAAAKHFTCQMRETILYPHTDSSQNVCAHLIIAEPRPADFLARFVKAAGFDPLHSLSTPCATSQTYTSTRILIFFLDVVMVRDVGCCVVGARRRGAIAKAAAHHSSKSHSTLAHCASLLRAQGRQMTRFGFVLSISLVRARARSPSVCHRSKPDFVSTVHQNSAQLA